MPLLADRFSLVAPDLRGLGDSSRPSKGYDKKTVAGRLRFVLPRRLGEVALFDDVPEEDVRQVLEEAMC